MDSLLKKKFDSLQNAKDFECWYLVKQPTEFSSICYLVSILEKYQNEHSSDVFQTYVESKISDINKEQHLDISSNYRALRIAAFYGLIKMETSSYQDSILTETYYEIKNRCEGNFENISTYSDIIQRQIEKMYASTSIDEKFDSVRSNFRLYPVLFLYKVLLEIGYATNNYSISLDEYRYLVATSTTYNKFLETLLLVQKWRDASDSDRNLFNSFRGKFDNRFIQALKQLTTLSIDSSNISLKRECISEVAQKVFSFEKYLRNEKFDDSKLVDFLCSKEWLVDEKNDDKKNENVDDEKQSHQENLEQSQKKAPEPYAKQPSQIIYYGVPGCGKSHAVDEEINKAINEYNEGKTDGDKISYEDQVKRIVFHPDYGNADFIGQIMPKIRERGGVDYVFKPGPFSQILRKAYLNSSKPYFLVIEEINRGNAAAIFGEMFQLLDRIKDNKKDKNGYGPGWSSYSILNDDVNDYIRDIKAYEKSDHSGCVKPNHPKDMLDGNGNPVDSPNANGKKEIDFSTATSYCSLELILRGFDSPQIFRESTAIRLPPNLSIYATMNTSDQNVFTLDNAFQRRWEMKQIPNDLKNTGDSAAQYCRTIKKVKKTESGEETVDTNVQWGDFRKAINEVIMDSAQANGLSSMEDKRLGGWFYTESDNFAEKVLKYLWDDAFKFDRKTQFGEIKTLEDLVKEFNKVGFKVFKADAISKLQRDSLTTPDTPAQNDTSVTNG